MSKKSLFYFFGLITAVIFMISACHNLFLPTAAKPLNTVTIKLSGWGASPVEHKLLRQILADFEVKNPDIQVEYEEIADQYMDVIKTRFIGDAAPDVFYLDALQAPFLMSQKVLEPLDNYVTPEFDVADFEGNLLNSFKFQNIIYGFPKDYSTLGLFYNKKAFAADGLSKPPTNWNELRSYSQKLTIDVNKDGKIDQYGFGVTPELARQAYKIKAFGGKLIDDNGYGVFASPPTFQALQPLVDQYRQEHSSALKSDVGTNSGSEMFGQGKVAMVIEGNWAIPYLQETFSNLGFATTELPKINDKKGTMVFTVAYVMNKKAKHKAQAWKLISYLTGKEGMYKWTKTGFALPTRKSVAKNLDYDQDMMKNLSPFIAGVNYATPWQIGKYPEAIMNSFDNQFLSTMLGEQPLQQAINKAQAEANRLIETMEY